MDNLSFLKILKYGLMLCFLSQLTAAVKDEDVDVPLLDNQNAPLFATLDMSKANRRVKEYVSEAVETKIHAIKESVKEYVNDEIGKLVEKIFKEKEFNNFTATVKVNTDTIRIIQDQQKQMIASFDSVGNLNNKSVEKKVKPRECADVDYIKDGVFVIYPIGENKPKRVFCVLEDRKKWTVIQRRFDFSVNFTRSWNEYKEGFGNAHGEHWLGNDYIHAISNNGRHKVKFNLWKDETEKYAEYSSFLVEDEQNKYKLKVSGYSGTAGESLDNGEYGRRANESEFSTYDQDNDNYGDFDCAAASQGGWWFDACQDSCLNGMGSHTMRWSTHMGLNLDKSMVMITKE